MPASFYDPRMKPYSEFLIKLFMNITVSRSIEIELIQLTELGETNDQW